MRRDCPASFHFSNKLRTAKRSPPVSLAFFLFLFLFPPPFFHVALGLREERGEKGREMHKERLRGRKEGRKEASEHEEGVLGEVSRGRGAISRLSIMEPVRSYREPAAGEELAFHPTNLS